MTLTVLSWNIRKAIGLDWRRDPARICAALAAFRPDIALIQEVDKRLGARPAALPRDMVEAAGLHPVDADPHTPSLGWHGNAVLVRPDIAVGEVHRIALPGLEPRGALQVSLNTGHGRIEVISAHLGLRRRDRRAQMAALLARMRDAPERVLLGGDLNEWSVVPDVLGIGQDWRMVVPGPSFHAALPRLALDRFVLRRDQRVADARVLRTPGTRRASDHLPVSIRLPLHDC